MMIQNSPPLSGLGASPLLTTILDEIVGSQNSQMGIDELGLAMATHVGIKRDRNEDRIAVARITSPNAETYTVVLVCDGVGGSESGAEAASLAIANIIADLALQQTSIPINILADELIRRADNIVRKTFQGRGATTLVMLLATESKYFVCANVGDSRAYSWNLESNKLNQVTIDDTIENELKDLPDNGAALIKARGLQGRLSQAIGEGGRTADELRVQLYTKEHFPLGAVLGSDGLWRAAKDFEILVSKATTPTDAVRRAIALANWVGGVDNASLIAIDNVERLFSKASIQPSDSRRQLEIVLWLPSTKTKILTSEWVSTTKSSQPRGKSEKPKSKPRKKNQREIIEDSQLKFESADLNEPRPKIEVLLIDDSKKVNKPK